MDDVIVWGRIRGHRAAYYDNPGIMQLDREDAQGCNRRPANDIAKTDGKDTSQHHGGRFFFKCGQVGLLLNGGADKIGFRNF